MNTAILDIYRLSAFFAANPTATIKDAQRLKLAKTNGTHFYRDCVHLRDSKGVHPYYALKSSLSEENYSTLRTRFSEEKQAKIIEKFQAGETIYKTAKHLSLHYQPVTIFSMVCQMAFTMKKKKSAKDKWTPYSRQQFEAMAKELRDYYQAHGRFSARNMQPELAEAIREMFAIGKNTKPNKARTEDIPNQHGESTDTSVASPEPKSNTVDKIISRLDKIEQSFSPAATKLPSVEAVFALDVAIAPNIDRWLSKEALTLLCKLVRGNYLHNRDEDAALLELDEYGLVEIPRHIGRDVMGGVTLLIDQLKVTDKGWSLHRLIRDICEQTVYCCLTDLGSFMGFNLAVKESDVR